MPSKAVRANTYGRFGQLIVYDRLMRHFILSLVAAIWALPIAAQDIETSPAIISLEAGVICPPPTVGSAPAPGTMAGSTHIIEDDPPFVTNVRTVPAVIGIGFGVKALSANDFGMEDVTIMVTHPPMGEDGITTQQFMTRISGVSPSITFYQFDYLYELVAGPWTLTALQNDQVLYSVAFDVVPARGVPELADICGYENLLS